jgi:hypothetical protein
MERGFRREAAYAATRSRSAPSRARGVEFREGASNWVDTPFLQATTFEHEHEHEHEHERRTPNAERKAPNAKRLVSGTRNWKSRGKARSRNGKFRKELLEIYRKPVAP